jgi:hypothetical protein
MHQYQLVPRLHTSLNFLKKFSMQANLLLPGVWTEKRAAIPESIDPEKPTVTRKTISIRMPYPSKPKK